nr:ORF28 [Bracoviriform inaniti]
MLDFVLDHVFRVLKAMLNNFGYRPTKEIKSQSALEPSTEWSSIVIRIAIFR